MTTPNDEPWFALGFDPNEIESWRNVFPSGEAMEAVQAERAATWRDAQYTADEAYAWVSAEDAPQVGLEATNRFRDHGWHPRQVSALRRLLSREGFGEERRCIEEWADLLPEVALTLARGGFRRHEAHQLAALPMVEMTRRAQERFERSAQIPVFEAMLYNHYLALFGGFYEVPDAERPWWARKLWDLHDEENSRSLRGGAPRSVDRPGARPSHARALALHERRQTQLWGIAANWLLPQPSGEPCPVEDFTDAVGAFDVDALVACRTRALLDAGLLLHAFGPDGEPALPPESHVKDYLARSIPLIDPEELSRWPVAATTVVVIDEPVPCQSCGREPARYVLDVASLGGEGLQALCPHDARPVTTYLGGEGVGHAAYLMLKDEVPRAVRNEVNLVLIASGRELHFPVRADGGW